MNEYDLCYEHVICELEYNEFRRYVEKSQILEESKLSDLWNKASSKLRKKVDFVKDLAKKLDLQVDELLEKFLHKEVYRFFHYFKFNLKLLFKAVKDGYKAWGQLHHAIADYMAKTKIAKFTEEHLKDLDEFLKKHPVLKTVGSLALAGMLIYIWTSLISFTGDFDFDFNQNTLFGALKGDLGFSDVFSGPGGIRMLMFVATGTALKVSFPWPGPTQTLFLSSVVYTMIKNLAMGK